MTNLESVVPSTQKAHAVLAKLLEHELLGAAGKSEYQGQTYYFCAPGCKGRFDANPQKFVK